MNEYRIDRHIEYRGYIAEITLDEIDQSFHAVVENSGAYPVAHATAPTLELLADEFANSLDIYFESCAEKGIPPIPPSPRRLSLRLNPTLYRRVALSAEAHGMSLDHWVQQELEKSVSRPNQP